MFRIYFLLLQSQFIFLTLMEKLFFFMVSRIQIFLKVIQFLLQFFNHFLLLDHQLNPKILLLATIILLLTLALNKILTLFHLFQLLFIVAEKAPNFLIIIIILIIKILLYDKIILQTHLRTNSILILAIFSIHFLNLFLANLTIIIIII